MMHKLTRTHLRKSFDDASHTFPTVILYWIKHARDIDYYESTGDLLFFFFPKEQGEKIISIKKYIEPGTWEIRLKLRFTFDCNDMSICHTYDIAALPAVRKAFEEAAAEKGVNHA